MTADRPRRVLETDSGVPLDRAFFGPPGGAADVAGQPGVFPYTRGIDADGYRDLLWHMDLYAGFGNADEAKARFADLLRHGATGINIALDLPTQLGLDSDDEDAAGEVGRVGLAVDTLADLEDLFADIDLREAGILFTVGNGIGPLAAALFMVAAERQGLADDEWTLHLQNDPLKEFTGRGAFVLPLEASIRLACDVVEHVARAGNVHWKPIGICGSQYRWGGGTAIEEIAYGIAGARVYIEELLRRGLSVDEFGPLLEMHLTADIDLFEEAAKFRAARRIWATMMREFGATAPEAEHLRVSLYTGGYRLTRQEPLNNSVRITIQALAAVLGGVQHIGTLSIDEALSTPSAEAARLAVRTQQILAYEARVGHVVDPLGGSHYVEWLTDELEARILAELAQVDGWGGGLAAVRSGSIQGRIDDRAYAFERDIASGRRVVVGVNSFRPEVATDPGIRPFRVDDSVESRQRERLAATRARRDADAVAGALRRLRQAAVDGENVMEPMKDAVRAYATVGEIYGMLRDVYGDWRADGIFL